jgi:acyl-CoA thioesterase FadM
MSALSLADMEMAGYARAAEGSCLLVRVPTDWPIEGEKRIGYVSILRLAECTRELHWRRDMAPLVDMTRLDSITRSVTADFKHPVIADAQIRCGYAVSWLRQRSYGLRITVSEEDGETLALIDLANVFIDPGTVQPINPDERIMAALRLLSVLDQPGAS